MLLLSLVTLRLVDCCFAECADLCFMWFALMVFWGFVFPVPLFWICCFVLWITLFFLVGALLSELFCVCYLFVDCWLFVCFSLLILLGWFVVVCY